MMQFARWSVKNPLIVTILTITFVGIGIYSFFTLPVEMQPYVESPVVGIITRYPGVSAEDMETYITRPIEQRMGLLDDVRWIRSTSQEGRSEVAVEFNYGTDMKKNLVTVQTLVNQLINELPIDRANTTMPRVVHIDAQNMPILDLNISRKGWDEVRLREFVENELRDRFESLPGVQSAIPFGGKRREVQIVVDRNKLAAYRFSILQIKEAVDKTNYSRSGGRVTARGQEFLVRTDERIRDPAELLSVPIGRFQDRLVYLKDVAKVIDTFAEVRSAYHFNGKPGILLTIVKQPWMGDPQVTEPALKLAKEFEREYPGLKIDVAFNRTETIELFIRGGVWELFLAVVATTLVITIFLQKLSFIAMAALTIPLATIFGLTFFKPFGLTINTPTLMGLTFVIGRLVDDAIVILDVVARHRAMGKDPVAATLDGMEEIKIPLVAAPISFVIVLFPMNVLGGAMGAGFYGMTMPMILANIGSLILAFTFNPMLLVKTFEWFGEWEERSWINRAINKGLTPVTWLINAMEMAYRQTLRWSLDHRLVVVGIAASSLYLALTVFPLLGWEMMPFQDTGIAAGEMEAWSGTSSEETEKMVSQLEKILLKQPEILKVSTMIGQEPVQGTFFTGYGVRTINKANFKITLTEKGQRVCLFYERWLDPLTGACSRKTGRSIWEILDKAQREAMTTVPGIRSLWLMEMGATPVNSARAPVEIVFQGPDLKATFDLAREGERIAQRTPGVYQPTTSASYDQPQYFIRVKKRRAHELGLTVRDITVQAYYALNGGKTAEFFKPPGGQRHSRILIRYRKDQRLTLEDLEQALITAPGGRQIPLKAVADVERRLGADIVSKQGLRYAVSVVGQYRDLGLKEATMGVIMGSRMSLNLPKGYTVGPKGLMLEMMDNLDRLNNGLTIALFILFLVLMVQMRSVSNAIVVMMAAPLELVGAFGLLYIRGFSYSPPVLWGLTIATVIVMATSIYLVDKIEHERAQGKSRREAILIAGPIRLRPIIMTAGTTAAAFLPPMFAPPAGMDRFMPIATAMVGAIATSTVLTLIVVPVVYDIFEDVKEFFRKLYSKETSESKIPGETGVLPPQEVAASAGSTEEPVI